MNKKIIISTFFSLFCLNLMAQDVSNINKENCKINISVKNNINFKNFYNATLNCGNTLFYDEFDDFELNVEEKINFINKLKISSVYENNLHKILVTEYKVYKDDEKENSFKNEIVETEIMKDKLISQYNIKDYIIDLEILNK